MPTNLYNAHTQWAYRPADEKFPSLEALYDFTNARKRTSKQELHFLNQLELKITPEGAIAMNGNSMPAKLSNWGFGQLCSAIGAPAKYLRTLPAQMARDCVQYALDKSDQQSKVLIRENYNNFKDSLNRWASAFTSQSYGRIWDADVVERLMDAVEDSSWHVPPSYSDNDSYSSGLYASDRDMFAFMINDENPVEVGNAKLGRGFFCWNSETGASTFGLTTFLYNYICGNHIVWGAEEVNELKIIHKSQALDRFHTYAIPTLNRFVENRRLDDKIKDTVGLAMNQRVGNMVEEALKYFIDKPFTKNEITNAWNTGISQGEDVTNIWGMVQGLTAYARDIPYMDRKVNLERRAGELLYN